MKISLPLKWALLSTASLSAFSLGAQISDPIPEPVTFGDITLELEDWITLPQTSGGGPGRTRISIMRSLPDDRLFVNDQRGPLYRIDTGTPTLYLNLRTAVSAFIDQPGLGVGFQSFAFHPEFLENGKFYTVHTELWNAQTPDFKGPTAPERSNGMQSVLLEWTADDPEANTFTGSRRELFRVYFPGNIHTMQEVAFNPNAGPEDADYGNLYVTMGDGGSFLRGYASNQHRLDSPMGTIFRIDPLGTDSANGQYGIPEDNPWFGAERLGLLQEIYAYGFRNPHRIIFDTGGTNRVYVGDIGERNIEELNLLLPGGDYGWPEREGTFLINPNDPQNSQRIFPLPANDESFGYLYPVAQYDHDEGIAIVPGAVYRGSDVPALQGLVLFGDIAWGRIFSVVEEDLELDKQVEITELRLTLNGVLGSLRSFVGNNRADLRWGMDNAGEVYVMTKTDGKIRRIVGATSIEDAISYDPDRWESVNAFAVDLGAWRTGNFAAQTARVPDPFGDADNGVLAMEGTGTAGYDIFPLTPEGSSGSIFFRFALEDETSSVQFDLGRIPASSTAFSPIIGSLKGTGEFTIRQGNSDLLLKDDLRPGIWYNVWILFLVDRTNFNIYIQGDSVTSVALLDSKLSLIQPLASGLVRFGMALTGPGAVYLDDLSVDTSMANLSVPFEPRWALLSNFEQGNALDIWSFMGSLDGAEVTFDGEVIVEQEISGNNYLSLTSGAGPAEYAYAMAPLPRPAEVSENLTLYTRIRVDNLNHAVSQHFGLVNLDPPSVVTQGLASIETSGWIYNIENGPAVGPLQLDINDWGNYVPALELVDGFTDAEWVEYWILARNGGEASGGQTFDVYMRPDGSDADPVPVLSDGDFQVGRERPVTLFAIIADSIPANAGAIHFDDLFVIEGTVFDRPAGTGYGLLPGAPGWKLLPWFGWANDTGFPWVFHETHGWLYAQSNHPMGGWFYDLEADWLGIYPLVYPNVYSVAETGWLYYLEGSASPRWFFRHSDQTWISVP